MTEAYVRAARSLGRSPVARHGEHVASTDMGNVSYLVPAIHPLIGYDTGGAVHHTAEFAASGTGAGADRAVLDGAVALALVGVDLAGNTVRRGELLDQVRLRAVSPTG